MSMTLVSSTVVGSGGAASITFSSIPQTGTDLMIIVSGRQTASTYLQTNFTINGSTSSFIWRAVYGWAGSKSTLAAASSALDYTLAYGSATANTFSNTSIYIPNYTAATNKVISVDSVGENDSSSANQLLGSGTWSNTAAITSINLGPVLTTYTENTIASLYLITKGSGGATVS